MALQPQAKPRVTPPPPGARAPTPEEIHEQMRDIINAQAGVIRAQAMYIASLTELLELPEPPTGP